jgi:hypothetical protein
MILFSGLILGSTTTSADSMRITALGGLNAAQLKIDPLPQNGTITPDLALTYGALFTADFIPVVKFDAGFMYKESKFSMIIPVSGSSVVNSKLTYEQFFIPVTMRFEFWIFSLGGGVYYTIPFVDKITQVNSGLISSTTTSTFKEMNVKNGNFGFMGTLGLRYKFTSLPIGLMADIWYLYGMNEMSAMPAMQSIKQNDVQLLFGISLYL